MEIGVLNDVGGMRLNNYKGRKMYKFKFKMERLILRLFGS